MNLNFVLSAIAAVTLHEASHVLAAWALGVKVKRIGLSWRGPYVVREAGTPLACVVISLAGPLANLLTVVVCLLAGRGANLCFTSFVLVPLICCRFPEVMVFGRAGCCGVWRQRPLSWRRSGACDKRSNCVECPLKSIGID